jgi:hypothetical protein
MVQASSVNISCPLQAETKGLSWSVKKIIEFSDEFHEIIGFWSEARKYYLAQNSVQCQINPDCYALKENRVYDVQVLRNPMQFVFISRNYLNSGLQIWSKILKHFYEISLISRNLRISERRNFSRNRNSEPCSW